LKFSRKLKIGLLGIAVSALALAFIVMQIDRDLFVQALTTANYWYLLPCLLLLLLGLLTRALRWQVLLDGDLPFWRAFSIMNVAYLVNGVLPLRIGEVARVYLASRVDDPVPIPKTTSTIIVERLLDLLAVVVMVLLALTSAPVPEQLRVTSAIGASVALAGFITLVVIARQRAWAHALYRLSLRIIPPLRRLPVLETWLDQFLDGLLPLTRPPQFLRAIAWTVISWVFSVLAGYVLMFAFFPTGSIATTMLYIAAVAFAIALPAVPGNIGTYEASILLALVAMGYEQSSTAVAFAVMVHAINVFVHASTGVVGFMQEGISLGQLSLGVQQMQQSSTSTEVG
jgi:glycosyltransferase 2 family protein